jgi:voltage-gated potassium channel
LYTVLWILFLIEFVTKFYFAKSKINFIKEDFFVILIIIFPFLRPLRVFSLSRMSMLIFAEQANDRFPIFRKIRILEILLFSIILVVLSADLFLKFETTSDSLYKNFGDALWFSMVTVATVGYGDIFPKTPQGRLLAGLLILFGVSIFGLVTASISSYLVEKDIQHEREQDKEEYSTLFNEEKALEHKMENLIEQEERLNSKLIEIEKKLH